MLEQFLETAAKDEPVYITDVRDAFDREGTLPFVLDVILYDDQLQRFSLKLPETKTVRENEFVSSYLYAMVYNILSSLGAARIDIYTDTASETARALAESLPETFQSGVRKALRSGYGKCMNVNDRVLYTLFGGEKKFSFRISDIKDLPEARSDRKDNFAGGPASGADTASVFAGLPRLASDKMLLGIDVGGTDIKLAASVGDELAVCKEYDWFPAGFSRVEEMTGPVLLLTRLMRCAAGLFAKGLKNQIDQRALSKDATLKQMEEGIVRMEKALGEDAEGFDAIGLSFPDVVIRNRIVGGECHKFKGMRDNPDLDFEKQFAKVSILNDILREYVKEDGAVMSTNDGPMAAFTSAVELAAAGCDVSKGFFAHTLGTELGTGWVLGDGSIPEIPLEVYNFIIDLGSFDQKAYPSGDVRSINNLNTQLAGTLQKYTCQSGVFRLAAKYLPSRDPELWQEVLDRGLIADFGGSWEVPTTPKDMRKSALEFFMEKAADGFHPVCSGFFREIGRYLAVTWQETEYILHPEAKERSLYGRLVKVPACFELMKEGAADRAPELVMTAADSSIANTQMMRQLDAHPDYTVAQFAQAVGAIYYGCLGLSR